MTALTVRPLCSGRGYVMTRRHTPFPPSSEEGTLLISFLKIHLNGLLRLYSQVQTLDLDLKDVPSSIEHGWQVSADVKRFCNFDTNTKSFPMLPVDKLKLFKVNV